MSSLPAELESSICGFLSITDLKSARQVNKRWEYIANPFLFEELWITQATFQILEDVSCHETLRFYVKKIVLNVLPVPVIPPTAWEDLIRLRSWHMSPEELALKFQRYKLLYDEQQRFASSDLGVATMRRAVDKLPQLLCLEGQAMAPAKQPMRYFVPSPSSPGYLDDLAIYHFVEALWLISRRDFRDAKTSMRKTLTGLFQSRSGRKIKQFSPGFLYSQFITMPSQPMLGLGLYEHLKALEVQIMFRIDIAMQMSGLQNTLSKTPYLEKLVLIMGHGRTCTCPDVLEGFRPSLPKLEHLEIWGGPTTGYTLISLLTQFTGSLRDLTIGNVSLVDQPLGQHSISWSQLLSIFVSEEWNLSRITLKDLSYFYRAIRTRKWLTTQCLLSIQDAISQRAALPEIEAYDDDGCAHKHSIRYYSHPPSYPIVKPIYWEILKRLRSEQRKERN